ncbi:hypothetical protein BH10PSE1_BH10PSE1_32670 [soil metagenome]
MSNRRTLMIAALLASVAMSANAQEAWTVKPAWVSAHENFLASPALRGRGGATNDEVVAATYVASVFERYGLTYAPGMTSYLQTAPLKVTTPGGGASLSIGDVMIEQGQGLSVLSSSGAAVSGSVAVAEGDDPAAIPAADVVLVAPPEGPTMRAWISGAMRKGAKVVVLRETQMLRGAAARASGPSYAVADEAGEDAGEASPDFLVLSPEAYDRLTAAVTTGATAALTPGVSTQSEAATTNAIGWLEGSDPSAGVIMISAHLDHLGIRDGVLYPGANDDASGTTAVLELAHALGEGERPKRSILFVAYGSEELGLLGSKYFGEHPPIPLERIVANLEIEMIGQQDPNMPKGVMTMTGFDRSDFGPLLKERGALVAPDPYPEQNFFQRSDNYSLALKGIVAHTVSGWATIPTYHSPEDTIASLDIPFMTAAIQSLVEPLRALADGEITPQWTAAGRPTPRP